jgi:hypothetical protein
MSDLRSILRNHLKEKLARDEVVALMTVRLCRSIEIAQIAAIAGFERLCVDLEHYPLMIDACCQICIAAQQIGLTPLVRVPANRGLCRSRSGWRRDGRDRAPHPLRCRGPRRRGPCQIPPHSAADRPGMRCRGLGTGTFRLPSSTPR